MRLEIISGIQILIIAFISYIVTITFAGWFESLVAKKVGDDVPEQAGFLTLNPLEHFNVFGFAAVLWGIFFARALPFQFIPGWGRYIHLMPDNIRGNYYKLRIFIEYIGRSGAHLIILIFAVTTMMIAYGSIAYIHQLTFLLTANSISLKDVLHFLLQQEKNAMLALLYFICAQNVVLFVIHFILGIFKYLIYFHMPKLQEVSVVTMIFGFILLLVGLSIFGPLLELFVAQIIEGIRSIMLFVIK